MQQIERLKSKILQTIEKCHKNGASACEIIAVQNIILDMNVRNQKFETGSFEQSNSYNLTTYIGQSKGEVSFTSFDNEDDVNQAINTSLNIAKFTAADPFAGLNEPNLMAKKMQELDLYHPEQITPKQAIELASNCEKAAFKQSKLITKGAGTNFNSVNKLMIYANSLDFLGVQQSTRYAVSCSMIAGEDQNMQIDSDYDVKCCFADLTEQIPLIGKRAADYTVQKLHARKIPTTKAAVLFSANTAKSLIAELLEALDGYNIYEKSSFLVDKLGHKIMPNWLQIDENPHLKRSLNSANFDLDGLATYPKQIITNGIIQNYILDTYSARKLNTRSTANSGGVHNILVSSNAGSQNDIITNISRGLLVTNFMGSAVNLVTGDYSRGVGGFWIENGAIKYPVQEITIASTLQEMFNQIIAVSSDIDMRSNIKTGAILIDNMTIAGN